MIRTGSLVKVNYVFSRNGMLNVAHLRGGTNGMSYDKETNFVVIGDRLSARPRGNETEPEMSYSDRSLAKSYLLAGSPDVEGAFWVTSNHFKVLFSC
jgi:hypothetical protein